MLSGSAFHRSYLGEEEKYVNLPKSINWQGTFILMRIPTNIPKTFYLYNYIEWRLFSHLQHDIKQYEESL